MNRSLLLGLVVLLLAAFGSWALVSQQPEPLSVLSGGLAPGEAAATRSSSSAAPVPRERAGTPDVAAAAPFQRERDGSAAARPGGAASLPDVDPLLAPQALIAQAGTALASREIREIFENPRPERRAAAIRQRARDDREGLVLAARALALSDPDEQVRIHAVEALGQVGEEQVLEELLTADEADDRVREKAQVALEDAIGFAKLEGLPVGDLIPYLRDPELWWPAMELVAAANDPSVAGELWDIYFDKSQGYERREYALFVLDDLEIEIDEPLEALWIEEEQAELAQLRQSGQLP